jgi:hypothetical protein
MVDAPEEGLRTYDDTALRFADLEVDANDTVHILKAETAGPDTVYYSRIPAGSGAQYAQLAIGVPDWGGSITGVQRPAMAVAPDGAAAILWNNYGAAGDPNQMFYSHVTSQGVVDVHNLEIWPAWDPGPFGMRHHRAGDRAQDQIGVFLYRFWAFGHARRWHFQCSGPGCIRCGGWSTTHHRATLHLHDG